MSAVDFRGQLRRQLRFLENSCHLYDAGDLDEAIRIGTCLRVLFHTTSASTSILKHMKAESCFLVSTALAERGCRDVFALVDIRHKVGRAGTFAAFPKLDGAQHRRFISFADWWNHEAILSAGGLDEGRATRRKLVLWAANQDGDAHVDEELAASYKAIIEGLGMEVHAVLVEDGVDRDDQRYSARLANLHVATYAKLRTKYWQAPISRGFRVHRRAPLGC